MKELRLEVTDDLMQEIEASAKFCLVTPEHYATSKLSQIFRKKESWPWLPLVVLVLETLASTLKNVIASRTQPSGNHDKEAQQQ